MVLCSGLCPYLLRWEASLPRSTDSAALRVTALVWTSILSPAPSLPASRCSAARRRGLFVVPRYLVWSSESLIAYWTA